jgi:acyl carrier protein
MRATATRSLRETDDGSGFMSRSEVSAEIVDVLGRVAKIDPSDATPEKGFDELGIDSLTMLDVVVALEDRFELLIPDEEWPRLRTIDDLSLYIEQATLTVS